MTAVSLHLGLNCLDPRAYGGWEGALAGCHNDARDWHQLATQQGFSPQIALDDLVTRDFVLKQFEEAASELKAGDFFLLTYSGHGGQVPDRNHEEDDGADETWCLFDGQLIDDEIEHCLRAFAPGVRVVVVSDSCHSGTVTRGRVTAPEGILAHRAAPPKSCAANADLIGKALAAAKRAAARDRAPLCSTRARILLFAACQDNQTAADGERNGLFTASVMGAWQGGHFRGNYHRLRRAAAAVMPWSQSPQLLLNSSAAKGFADQRPFTP